MTAFAQDQLFGDDIRFAGLRTEQIIGRLPLGLRGDMRLGLALEAAQVGPSYLGFGYSTSGVSSLFLSIGTP